jgi:8-oxo-dGTP pyrophosphatase MutT (NUDIX family)
MSDKCSSGTVGVVTVEATLCAIIRNDRILLQRKAAGRFGEGKWNGAGGKLKQGEAPADGVIREVLEETGLRIREPRRHGVLDHYFGDRVTPAWSVHVFSATDFEGEPTGGEEGELNWFPLEKISYGDMWEDDIHWLPLLLEGRDFDGAFYFNEDASRLLDFRLSTG